MKLECSIVKDLVSTYKDGIASAVTSSSVKDHLVSCADCRDFYKNYDRIPEKINLEEKIKTPINLSLPVEENFLILTKKIKHKKKIKYSTFAGVGVLLGASVVLNIMLAKKLEQAQTKRRNRL